LGGVLKWKLSPNVARQPGYRPAPLALPPAGWSDFLALPRQPTKIFWIGHASFLMELDDARIVIDPVFGKASLVPRVTPAAVQPGELGAVSAVLVTHGHHDHLDPKSLLALQREGGGRTLFIVPEGLGRALPSACQPRVELGWWQYVEVEGVKVHLVPAQHWHQRGALDRNRSLWGGFVVEGTHRVFHSGDTGYFEGFRAVGEAFGGIDAACLPLGAYEPRWFMEGQHMSPEHSLAALADLQCTHLIGMHWGAFDLSNEPLTAGPHCVLAAVQAGQLAEENAHVLLPGGSVALAGAQGRTRAQRRHRFCSEGERALLRSGAPEQDARDA
jgi:L-ascorbate metabolism protein UlaG (beta-lactamase superfamily)